MTPLTNSNIELHKKPSTEKLPASSGRKKMKMLYHNNSNSQKTTLNLGGSEHVVHMSTIIKNKKEYMDAKTKREDEMHRIDLKNSQMALKSKKMQHNALAMVNRREEKKANPSISEDELNSLFPLEPYK